MPKVSVIIPVYNKEQQVQEALSSILGQSYQDFEVVIVDDASTDTSYTVVSHFEDERIRSYKNETNLGTAGNGNRCLDLCTGQYIIRMDADDVSLHDRLEKQVKFMDENPDIVASSGSMELFGEARETWTLPLNDSDTKAAMIFFSAIHQPASVIRRAVLEDNSFRYDSQGPQVGEDWLLWTKLGRQHKLGNLEETLVRYRIGKDNISRQEKFTSWESRRELLASILTSYGINPTSEQLEWHNMLSWKIHRAVTPQDIVGIRGWLEFLSDSNEHAQISHTSAFQNRLDAQWDRLFYLVSDYGKEVVDAYAEAAGGLDPAKTKYLRKSKISKWIGR